VKQHLAAIRALFDWFVIHQVVPFNPCAPVKGPRYSIRVGKTPVLSLEDTRKLLAAIGTQTPIDLRDRAIIAFMFFTFTRISATLGIDIGDLYTQDGKPWVRLREKGGRDHTVALHPDLEAMISAYMGELTDLGKETPLFRAALNRSGMLSTNRLDRRAAWAMIQRRATLAGLASHATCHSFRATGITSYLEHGGTLDAASTMAAHASTRTTELYDRRLSCSPNDNPDHTWV
jgi:site-specific recombinase XerD